MANCLIFHNVCSLTRVIGRLQDEGEDVPAAALASVSPYLAEHINRFEDYVLNMNRKPPRPAYEFTCGRDQRLLDEMAYSQANRCHTSVCARLRSATL